MEKKGILPATNNFKDITSVYITGKDQKGNTTYERKYTAGWSNKKIYCEKCSYVAPFCNETTLTDIADLEKIKEYDNRVYGGTFE